MGDHDRDQQQAQPAPPQPQPAPPVQSDAPRYEGPGVAELGRLLAQHNPPTAAAVVGILRRHPADRLAIMGVLRRECPSIVGQVVVMDSLSNPMSLVPYGAGAPAANPLTQPGPAPAATEGPESPLTAEGDNSELTVGAEASRQRGGTTVTGSAGVTVGREDGVAGAQSVQATGSVSHHAGPVTMEASLELARHAGGRVSIEGEGTITITLTRWAELRLQGKIDDQGHATASAGLTINLLRAFGVQAPGGLQLNLTGNAGTSTEGGPQGGIGLQLRF